MALCRGGRVFFHHRGTEGTEIFGKRARIRGQWVCGVVGGGTGFFHHKDTKSTKIFMVGRRRFERGEPGGDCALLGMVQVFFHHRGHRGHRDFCREGVDSRSVGLARCSGWYRFFHHRGTEVSEIFCGGKAPIRGQWEWRFVGGGRGFFHHRGHRGHRDFYGGKASIRMRGEPGGDCALSRVVQLFFTTEAQRAPRFFMVGGRGFEVSGNCALLGVGGFFSPPRHRGHRDFW